MQQGIKINKRLSGCTMCVYHTYTSKFPEDQGCFILCGFENLWRAIGMFLRKARLLSIAAHSEFCTNTSTCCLPGRDHSALIKSPWSL